jgi:hypothetical protein
MTSLHFRSGFIKASVIGFGPMKKEKGKKERYLALFAKRWKFPNTDKIRVDMSQLNY